MINVFSDLGPMHCDLDRSRNAQPRNFAIDRDDCDRCVDSWQHNPFT
jgi:hypothetical protein